MPGNILQYVITLDDHATHFDFDRFYRSFCDKYDTSENKLNTLTDALATLDNPVLLKRFEKTFLTANPASEGLLKKALKKLDKDEKQKPTELMSRFFSAHYPGLYYHELKQKWYFNQQKESKELNLDSMFLRTKDEKLEIKERDLMNYLRSPDHTFYYNPINDYFKSLPKWDGRDHIARFVELFDIRENIEGINRRQFITQMMRKWFVRILIQFFEGSDMKRINKTNLLLLSPSNSGKTTFCKIHQETATSYMFPLGFAEYFTENFLWDMKDNNTKTAMSTNIIIMQDEFNGFVNQAYNPSNKGIQAFKQITGNSNFDITNRGKRGSLPRRASFVFTANPDKFFFVTDSLLERFIILDFMNNGANKLPFNRWTQADVVQLWAQINQLYKEGYDAIINEDENKINVEINRHYMTDRINTLADFIKAFIKPADRKNGTPYTATELLEKIKQSEKLPHKIKLVITTETLGRALMKNLDVNKANVREKSTHQAYYLICDF